MPNTDADGGTAIGTPDPDQMLSIGQAAALIGVHVDTLKRWETVGVLIPGRTPTNRRRYRRADVLAAIKTPRPAAKPAS